MQHRVPDKQIEEREKKTQREKWMWCASVTHRLFRGSHVLILVFLFSLNKVISKQVKLKLFWIFMVLDLGIRYRYNIIVHAAFTCYHLPLRWTINFELTHWFIVCLRFDITIKIFFFYEMISSFLQYYYSSARHWMWWRMMERFLGIMDDDNDDTHSGSNMKFYSFIWGHSKWACIETRAYLVPLDCLVCLLRKFTISHCLRRTSSILTND